MYGRALGTYQRKPTSITSNLLSYNQIRAWFSRPRNQNKLHIEWRPPGIVMRLFTISWLRHSVWIFRLPRTSYVVNNDDVAPPLSFEQLQSRRVCNPTPHPMTIKNDAEHHSKCTDAPPARIKSSDTNILVISFFTQLQLIRAEGTSLQEDDASHRINYSSVISRSWEAASIHIRELW